MLVAAVPFMIIWDLISGNRVAKLEAQLAKSKERSRGARTVPMPSKSLIVSASLMLSEARRAPRLCKRHCSRAVRMAVWRVSNG